MFDEILRRFSSPHLFQVVGPGMLSITSDNLERVHGILRAAFDPGENIHRNWMGQKLCHIQDMVWTFQVRTWLSGEMVTFLY